METTLSYLPATRLLARRRALLPLTILSAGLLLVACSDDTAAVPAAGGTAAQGGEDGDPAGAGSGGRGGVGASGGDGEAPGSTAGEAASGGAAGDSTSAGAAGVVGEGGAAGEGGAGWHVPEEPPSFGYSDSAPIPQGVPAYVDSGATNQRGQACLSTLETNAGVRVLSEFLKVWAPRAAANGTVYVDAGVTAPADGTCAEIVGSDWSGIPSEPTDGKVLLPAVHAANLVYVVRATKERTAEQELAAYLDDRRGKNFSISDGMGPLTAAWRAGSKQTTTIAGMAADATSVKYDDKGNNRGEGSVTNPDLGLAVDFENAMSGDGSTEPAKRYFKYARPYRWTNEVVVAPSLVPAKSATPTTDGGFISGHTAEAFRDALAMGYLVPQRFQEMLARAAELGQNRINSGMHSPLDVIGGRIQATAVVAYNLNKTDTATLAQSGFEQAQSWLKNQTETKSFRELYDYAHAGSAGDRFSNHVVNRENFRSRMTYGFAPIASGSRPAVVPKGAEALLATRFPCLSVEQRRVVLKTTAWASGYPVMDDAEGWGRLDLFAAADGYGAFEADVNLDLDAAKGGFCEQDVFRNDITGEGRLRKAGTGALWLAGNNSYAGGTLLVDGSLGALSPSAFGTGDVYVQGGTLLNGSRKALQMAGAYTQLAGALALELGEDLAGGLQIGGAAYLAGGQLQIRFVRGVPAAGTVVNVLRAREVHGRFDQISVEGVSQFEVTYSATGVAIRLK